jgi:ribose transport system permease protein
VNQPSAPQPRNQETERDQVQADLKRAPDVLENPSATPTTSSHEPHKGSPLLGLLLRLIQLGPILILAITWLGFSLASPVFFSRINLSNLVSQSSVVAVLALGALVVILVGQLDLSIATNMGLTAVVGAWVFNHGAPGWSVIPLMVGCAAAAGLANAVLVIFLRFGNSFIVTLGMLYVLLSISYVVSGGASIPGLPDSITGIASAKVYGVPGPALVVLLCGGLLAFMLRSLLWGRWVYALGGNPGAAERMGIPVRFIQASAFVIGGAFAGVAAILVAGRANAGFPDSGNTVLLAIASVVIGGASLTGGRGSVLGTVVGALILGSITNGLGLMSVNPNYVPLAVGGVLVAAIGVDSVRLKVEERLKLHQARAQSGVTS